MGLKIVRNDITKMNTEAIVNTANPRAAFGPGCDSAIYWAAGADKLLAYRTEKIGPVPEGEVFITPGFDLPAKYIIHAVSPKFLGGNEGEEEKLRSCYRKSLQLAKEYGIRSVAFPLISTGSFGYPKEEGLRIAADEINAFLLKNEMDIFLVVFDDRASSLGKRIDPGLEEYIDRNYVEERRREEYDSFCSTAEQAYPEENRRVSIFGRCRKRTSQKAEKPGSMESCGSSQAPVIQTPSVQGLSSKESFIEFDEKHESRLEERIKHMSDTFSQYLMYLIRDKNMQNADVYKRAVVDKKIFSKIKNNSDYHPQKLTALCLCVGAKLNLDETRDLLARAGYALSPSDKTDIIFSYFIENEIYDMIELDIQLEEHGLPCIIT